MLLVKKILGFIGIFITCFINLCSCQTTRLNLFSDINLLKGYFILYRSEVIQKDRDNIQPREFYNGFYVKKLSQNVLAEFINRDSLNLNIFCIGKPWGLVIVDDEHKRDSIYKVIQKHTTFKEMDVDTTFNTTYVPKNIFNSNDRFMIVYEGQLAAVGPFVTTNSIPKERQESYGYLYLEDQRNSLKYLYTIVLSPSTSNSITK